MAQWEEEEEEESAAMQGRIMQSNLIPLSDAPLDVGHGIPSNNDDEGGRVLLLLFDSLLGKPASARTTKQLLKRNDHGLHLSVLLDVLCSKQVNFKRIKFTYTPTLKLENRGFKMNMQIDDTNQIKKSSLKP